jgi:hypothetical protein
MTYQIFTESYDYESKPKYTDYNIKSDENSFFSAKRKCMESDESKREYKYTKKLNTSVSHTFSLNYLKILIELLSRMFIKRRRMTFHMLIVILGNRYKNKVNSIKMLYRITKRRILFYKLKLFHRCKDFINLVMLIYNFHKNKIN